MNDSHEPALCHWCGESMRRIYAPPMIKCSGESISYFHPSLGQVVRSDDHARALAKEKGWVEVGNEDMKKHATTPVRKSYDADDYFIDNGSISLNG